MADLEPRKRSILRAVVVEYVAGAEPVGSELIVRKHGLGVKSATVRNELAEMSEMGLLEQPHTSAGRIPSDQGYRYFVDHLITNRELEPSSRKEVEGVVDDGDVLQTMVRDATRALSRLTQLLSAATIVRDERLTVLNVIVSAMGPHQALLVVVLSNGQVENRILECPPGITLADIGIVNEALGHHVAGKSVRSLVKSRAPSLAGPPSQDALMTAVWTLLRSAATDLTQGELVTEGEEFIFAQPEVRRDAEFMQAVLRSLENIDVLYNDLQDTTASDQGVTIGKEHRREDMQKLSIVRRRFFVGSNEAGTIAVIGPTRMHYETSIPLVDFTAKALSDALTRYLAD